MKHPRLAVLAATFLCFSSFIIAMACNAGDRHRGNHHHQQKMSYPVAAAKPTQPSRSEYSCANYQAPTARSASKSFNRTYVLSGSGPRKAYHPFLEHQRSSQSWCSLGSEEISLLIVSMEPDRRLSCLALWRRI